MCLGSTTSHCYIGTDSEYTDYYDDSARASSALYTASRISPYSLSIINAAQGFQDDAEFRKCSAYAELQNYKTNPGLVEVANRLPETCRNAYYKYFCNLQCSYAAIYLHIWSQANDEDKLRMRTENDYDITRSREFVLHSGQRFQMNCANNPPTATINNAVCDTYQQPPLPDPADVLYRLCGPINLSPATFTATMSFHTDAPMSILTTRLREISSWANSTVSGQDVLTYTSSIVASGSNSTGTTYVITVSFTGPSAIASNAASSVKYLGQNLVTSIPGSTAGPVSVSQPPSTGFASQLLPSLALILIFALIAMSLY